MKTALLALSLVTSAALSAPKTIEEMPLEELKQLYWVCDYNASHSFLDQSDAAFCSFVYESLLVKLTPSATTPAERWIEFHKWWTANKTTEYNKISAAAK